MNNPGLKQVLFVCGDNGFLSQMAEGFARLHGSGRLEAYSAGYNPSEQVDAQAVNLMKQRGWDLSRQHPKSFIELPDVAFDYLIILEGKGGSEAPQATVTEHWAVPNPSLLEPEQLAEVRDEIEMRVVDLISRLGD